MYITTKAKLWLSLCFAALWVTFSMTFALPWIQDLSAIVGGFLAWAIVLGVAIIPGFANGFILPALLLDSRPQYLIPEELPDISILIAAYNEENVVAETFEGIAKQEYPGRVHVCFVDDGSTDLTRRAAKDWIKDAEYDDGQFTEVKLYLGRTVSKNADLKLIHDRIISTGTGYRYEWSWTGVNFEYRF